MTCVSIPNLVSDVSKYTKYRRKYNLHHNLNKFFFGFLFNNSKSYYYSRYIRYMRKLENKYKTVNTIVPVLPDYSYIPPPSAPRNIF